MIRCLTGSQWSSCTVELTSSARTSLFLWWYEPQRSELFAICAAAGHWHQPRRCCSSRVDCQQTRVQCLCGLNRQWLLDRPQLSKLKEAGLTECSNVVSHGQLAVKSNAKIVDEFRKLHCSVRQSQTVDRGFTELLTCTQLDNLRLVFL